MSNPEAVAVSVIHKPWFRWFWRVLAVFWMVMFGVEMRAMLSGDAESYRFQHLHGLLIEGGGALLALSFLAANRSVRWALLGGAMAFAAINVALNWMVR